ncbi:hypothetical protein F6X37_24625 [Paraburkholderia sp. 31.1]|nr:hypothetical protein [Paraburkholderia sp. 31.1]
MYKMPEGDPLRYITQAAQNAPNSHRFTCSRSLAYEKIRILRAPQLLHRNRVVGLNHIGSLREETSHHTP